MSRSAANLKRWPHPWPVTAQLCRCAAITRLYFDYASGRDPISRCSKPEPEAVGNRATSNPWIAKKRAKPQYALRCWGLKSSPRRGLLEIYTSTCILGVVLTIPSHPSRNPFSCLGHGLVNDHRRGWLDSTSRFCDARCRLFHLSLFSEKTPVPSA